MEEPDYDDMINDYIEDDFEPPSNEYEDMYEEMMNDSGPPTTTTTTEAAPSSTQPPANINNENDSMDVDPPRSTLATTLPLDDDDEGMASVRDFRSRQQQDANLFNFDRYNKKGDWRRTPLSPNSKASQKNSFKSKGTNSVVFQRMRKATAPDANLIELLNRRRAPCSKMRLSKSGKSAILRNPKEGVSTLPMTLFDGTRVYVQSSPRQKENGPSNDTSKSTNSLGVSMKELKRRSDLIRRKNISRSTTTIRRKNNGIVDKGQLWVDKHAPSSFPHLLSDERTNREVLRALRAWDPYVFGREAPARPASYVQFQQQQQQQKQNSEQPKPEKNPHDKRPEENNRVILLAGPPGVGKTTLAHIIARHAGYRPMEVNASDERSASVLTDRVRRAMESTTIKLKSDHPDLGKPNCLILDEIDGADAKGAIQALVEIIRADLPAKGSKGKKAPYLRRPIIFICNHKYAPALRPLLPFARHFNVDPPSPSRLVARLKAVLGREKIPMMAGGSLLHQLVVSSGGDIRSCLFTLQFASTRATSDDISQALTLSLGGSGLKDDRGDIASTLTTVFRKVKTKSISTLVERDDRASVTRVLNAVEGLNDNLSTMNALFLNLPRVSYIDPSLDRCSAAHEWLSGADGMESYSSWHVPSVAGAIHLLCRVELKPDLNFSTREFADIHYRRETNFGLVQKFSECLPAKANGVKCQKLLSIELIPYALWMLSAGTGNASLSRAASSIDILTKPERESVDAHVALLRALGLTYVSAGEDPNDQSRGKEGSIPFHTNQKKMVLEPPIDRLVMYREFRFPPGLGRLAIPTAMKEMIAHEVKLDSFRQKDAKTLTPSSKSVVKKASPTSVVEANDTSVKSPPKKLDTRKLDDIVMSVPAPKRLKTQPSPTQNFLGLGAKRAKLQKSARKAAAVGLTQKKTKMAHTGSGFRLNQVIRLRYVKGFTQAVRAPCRLQDLE